MDDLSAWLEVVEGARCAQHATEDATAICARCGGFQCPTCLDEKSGRCHPCAVAELEQRLPRLARSVAWKLVLVPALVGLSYGAVTLGRGLGLTPADPWLALWIVPLVCGLRLVVRPSVAAAWVGSVVSVALVGVQLAPDALSGESMLRVLDLVLIGAAPIAAMVTTLKLSRSAKALQWAAASAS